MFALGRNPDEPCIDVSAHLTPAGSPQSQDDVVYWTALKNTLAEEIGLRGRLFPNFHEIIVYAETPQIALHYQILESGHFFMFQHSRGLVVLTVTIFWDI
jgi:hypothetical protein